MEFEPYPHYISPADRIDALESQLREKDAELERLRALVDEWFDTANSLRSHTQPTGEPGK